MKLEKIAEYVLNDAWITIFSGIILLIIGQAYQTITHTQHSILFWATWFSIGITILRYPVYTAFFLLQTEPETEKATA